MNRLTGSKARLNSKHRAMFFQVYLLRVLALATILGTWFYLQGPGGVSPVILPQMSAVFVEFVNFLGDGDTYRHIAVTMGEIFSALGIAALFGFLVGFWAARTPRRAALLEPLLIWGYLVPLILFYPLFLLWFGFGIWSKIAFAATTSFFPIAFNCLRGFARIHPEYLSVGRAYGASRRQLDWSIKLPAALPMAAAGLKVGAALCMITVIVAEMIASTQGLGHLIRFYSQSFAPARTYAVILLVLAIVWVFHFVVRTILSENNHVSAD